MQRTNLFLGLTRPVNFAGLPMIYLGVYLMVTMLVFVSTNSFFYPLLIAAPGYLALRALAAYDPKLMDVFLVAVRATPMDIDLFTKKGMTYRA